jgi:hypothetical protein
MKIPGRVVSISSFVFAFLLTAPLPSRAQMRMAPMGTRPVGAISMRAARPMRPIATHAAPVAGPRITWHTAAAPFIPPANNNFNFGNGFNFDNGFYGGSGETLQQLLDPVPGPGFDYSYLAGIDKDLALKALIDPQTEERLAVAEQVARATGGFGGAGYYLLDGGGGYIVPAETAAETGPNDQPEQPQRPEVIVLQQPAQKSAEESAAEPPQPAQPVPDVGNFMLVLKNGNKIQAMAFTRLGGQIIYITPNGDRHTISASDVNDTATQQLNQDSGKELRF